MLFTDKLPDNGIHTLDGLYANKYVKLKRDIIRWS